jgi:hypothetical protein
MSSEEKIVNVGGSTENALAGNYKIDIKKTLIEAWEITLLSRRSINLGLIFIITLVAIATLFISNYFGGFIETINNENSIMVLNILTTLLIAPFMAGVEMMGVFHSIKLKTQPKLIFSFFKRATPLGITALITSLFVNIGSQLFVVPGIILLVLFSLTIPLVVEKQLSPDKAIILSVKALRFQLFNILGVYSIISVAFVLSLFPLLVLQDSPLLIVGLVLFFFFSSYLLPLFYNVKGILYREIFGLKVVTTSKASFDPTEQNNDTFSA